MAWLSFAKDVLNQAQKTIDKALDIKDDVTNESIGKDIETFFASYGIGKETETKLLHESFNVAVKSQSDNNLAEPNSTNDCSRDSNIKTEPIVEGQENPEIEDTNEVEVATIKSTPYYLSTEVIEYDKVKEEDSDQQTSILENSFTNIDAGNSSLIHSQLTFEQELQDPIDNEIRTVLEVKIECAVNEPSSEIVPSTSIIRCEKSSEESVAMETLGASDETELLEHKKKISELEDLLNVRERKLLEFNEICAGYMNEIDQLKRSSALEDQSRSTSKPSSTDHNSGQNLETHQLEAQLKKLDDLSETHVAKLRDELREKETVIQELRLEGEKLSKQNFQQSNIIKSLRIKEKDNEQHSSEWREKNDELKNEVDRLKNVLAMKEESERTHMDAVKQLTNKKELLEKELTTNKVVARDAFTESESLRKALSESTKKLTAMQADLTTRDKAEADRNLSIEVSVRQQLQLEFNKSSESYEEEKKALTFRCQELSQMLVNADRQLLIEKERAKTELSQLMQRLQETESRSEELSQALTTAAKPLQRQILILQQSLSALKLADDNEKKILEDQLNEAKQTIVAVSEKHITSKNLCIALQSKVNELSEQLNDYVMQNKQLAVQLGEEKSLHLTLEESKSKNSVNIEIIKRELGQEIQTLQWKLNTLEQNFEIQSAALQEEKLKSSTLSQILQEKDHTSKSLHLDIRSVEEKRTNSHSSSPTPSLGKISLSGSFESSVSHSSNPWNSTDEVLDCNGLATPTPVPRSTLYDSIRTGSYTAVFENLQSQMKSRDGEITHLQQALQSQEQSRDALAQELSRTVAANQELMQRLEVLEQLKIDFAELKTKYNALLQMYGEKIEENEELRLDLVDVKEMYKIQIDQLMKLE